tara:strand:+ start:650 stop:1198 length:549 start_codon:yes stop_codon:yes gene_type:complete
MNKLKTIEIIQELLKTDSNDFETLLGKYNEYQSKLFAFKCAGKIIETQREKELYQELDIRSKDHNDKFFIEFETYNETKKEQAFQELCQMYSKIMNAEIKKVNMFEIIERLCVLDKEIFDKLCIIFDPKQIVLKLDDIKIVDKDGKDMNACREDLYKDVLFKYDFRNLFDILYYCNDTRTKK